MEDLWAIIVFVLFILGGSRSEERRATKIKKGKRRKRKIDNDELSVYRGFCLWAKSPLTNVLLGKVMHRKHLFCGKPA